MFKPNLPNIPSGIEELDDNESLASSIIESSIEDTLSEVDADIEVDDSEQYTTIREPPIVSSNSLKSQLEKMTHLGTYNNIRVSNSTNVVFGNVIKVKGVLNINVYEDNNGMKNQKANIELDHRKRGKSPQPESSFTVCTNSSTCFIIPRNCWLALEPSDDYIYINEPVDIVVICHTGTETAISSSQNMEILRNIQTFHIDTQGWGDIGYNFLIGCDGNIYEGRGWGVVGTHTIGYNSKSIGIAFIGSFSTSLPTDKALYSCKKLLKRGRNDGYLKSDYKLLGHRQCISTVSPGRLLYEEISKWEQFYNKNVADNLNN